MKYDPIEHLEHLEENIEELIKQFNAMAEQHLQQAWMMEQLSSQFTNIGKCLEILHDRMEKLENEKKFVNTARKPRSKKDMGNTH
jgi:uncharacterized protein (UPF0335 family)